MAQTQAGPEATSECQVELKGQELRLPQAPSPAHWQARTMPQMEMAETGSLRAAGCSTSWMSPERRQGPLSAQAATAVAIAAGTCSASSEVVQPCVSKTGPAAVATAGASLRLGAPGALTAQAIQDGSLRSLLAPHLTISRYACSLAGLEEAARIAVCNVINGTAAPSPDRQASNRHDGDFPGWLGAAVRGGLADWFGFQHGACGSTANTCEALAADLIGGAGPVPTLSQAISRLHQATFATYQLWAAHIGADATISSAGCSPQDVHTMLSELALWYLMRGEAGTLTACPELMCWLFCQMRRQRFYIVPRPLRAAVRCVSTTLLPTTTTAATTGSGLSMAAQAPPPEALGGCPAEPSGTSSAAASIADDGLSFFQHTTIQPLCDLLQDAAAGSVASRQPGEQSSARGSCRGGCCCRRSAQPESAAAASELAASARQLNLDDLNEAFWQPAVLEVAYHCMDATCGLQSLRPIRKTYRERSSFLALLAVTSSYWMFAVVFALACAPVALTIAERGGSGIRDLGVMSVGFFLERLTAWSMLALSAGKLVQLCLYAVHSAPPLRSRRRRSAGDWRQWLKTRACYMVLPTAYHVAWAAGFWVVYWVGPGVGSAVWWVIVAARLACLLLGNGILHGLLEHSGWHASSLLLRGEQLLTDTERGYVDVPRGGPEAGDLLRQSTRHIAAYTAVWLAILAGKFAFDITILTETARTARDVQTRSLPLAWGFTSSGSENAWLSVGLWITAGLVLAIDSYVAVSIVAPLLATALAKRDGVGITRTMHDVTQLLLRRAAARHHLRTSNRHLMSHTQASNADGVRGDSDSESGTGRADSTAGQSLQMQFLRKCLPQALEAQAALQRATAAAGGTSTMPTETVRWLEEARLAVSADTIFGTAWNGCLRCMREGDLLSDAEVQLLTYGSGLLLPLAAASTAGATSHQAGVAADVQGAAACSGTVCVAQPALAAVPERNVQSDLESPGGQPYVPQLPLFLYGGCIRAALEDPRDLSTLARSASSDVELLAMLQLHNPMLHLAVSELRASLPPVLHMVAMSHPRTRPEDSAAVWAAVNATLEPRDTDWRSIILLHCKQSRHADASVGGKHVGRGHSGTTASPSLPAATLDTARRAHQTLTTALQFLCTANGTASTQTAGVSTFAAAAGAQPVSPLSALYASCASFIVSANAVVAPAAAPAGCSSGAAVTTATGAIASSIVTSAVGAGGGSVHSSGTPVWLADVLQPTGSAASPLPLQAALREQLHSRGLADAFDSLAQHAKRALMLLEQPPAPPGISLAVEEVSLSPKFAVSRARQRSL